MKFISVDIDFLDIYSKNLDEEYKNLHLKMAEIFGFPDFYGKNLAALIDCLSDLRAFRDEEPMTRYSLNDEECLLLNVGNLSKASNDLRRKFLLALEAVNTRLSAGKTPTILVNLTSKG